MDVDRMRQQQKRDEERTCYRCQRKGHISTNCPVKQVNELSQEQINSIVTAHLASSAPRPPVTVEEVQDEDAPDPPAQQEQEQEEQPQYWFEEDQDNLYEVDEDFY